MDEKEFIERKSSGIHRHGVFAIKDIPANTTISEYKGIKIDKATSKLIQDHMLDMHLKDPNNNAGTYIFELDEKWDLDGDVPGNECKYINHSCEPNCDVDILDGKIWIRTIKDIKKGEEITYNYGFEIDKEKPWTVKYHPCKCGSKKCVGYILAEEQWPLLEKALLVQEK